MYMQYLLYFNNISICNTYNVLCVKLMFHVNSTQLNSTQLNLNLLSNQCSGESDDKPKEYIVILFHKITKLKSLEFSITMLLSCIISNLL